MSLISHLSGSPALSGPVGKGATNIPADVKSVKALLNVHRRADKQPALSMDTGADEALFKLIESFQKEQLKLPAPDGCIDPGGKTLNGLLRSLRECYSVQAIIAPEKGKLTWETEGHEGGPLHSRRLHVPDGNSGLTLGRGYDLRQRMSPSVQSDLAYAGMTGDMAFKISTAVGRAGMVASRFVIDNDLIDFEISPSTQLKLFEKVYEEKLKEVKRISELANSVRDYGKVNWEKLDRKIMDILVDLVYRGDYTDTTRKFLQIHVANNDLNKFSAEIVKKSNWPKVPEDRFGRRKAYVE